MHLRTHVITMFSPAQLHRRWTVDAVAAYLLVLSACYLAIPHIIFFFGWLLWPWAVLATGVVGAGLLATAHFAAQLLTRDTAADGPADDTTFVFTRQHALAIGAICLIWLTLSGVGGFVSQDLDWNKHNTVLNSLILKPWPTVYEIYQVDIPLVYYIGFYLPAALVGKAGGWFWANQALFVWSYAGLVIAALWFCVLVRRASYTALLVFVFFSGLDVIGFLMAQNFGIINTGRVSWMHIEPWARGLQFSSHATLLNWVPNQALAGWIVTGMLLYCLVRLQRRDVVLLPFGLSALWSPFVTVGIVPFLVLDFLINKAPLTRRLRDLATLPNAAGVVALVITGFYFSAKAAQGSPIVVETLFGGLSIESYSGSTLNGIIFVIFFCLLEFGLYAIVLYRSGAVQDDRWRWMLDSTVLTLAILPWFKLGVYNDLVMRASIPALFVLAVIVARALHDNNVERQTRIALVVLIVVGAGTAFVEFRRHVERMATISAPIFDEKVKPWDFVEYMKNQVYFFGQYSGAIDSPFFRYAAKPISAASAAVAGSKEYELNAHDFVLYGEKIYLLRDTVTMPAEIEAASSFTVSWQLHFFGPGMDQPYAPVVQLVGEDGESVWRATTWPGGAPEISPFWMTHWSGEITATVPLTAAPGLYSLEMGFVGSESNTYLSAETVPEAEPLGDLVPVATVEVMGRE